MSSGRLTARRGGRAPSGAGGRRTARGAPTSAARPRSARCQPRTPPAAPPRPASRPSSATATVTCGRFVSPVCVARLGRPASASASQPRGCAAPSRDRAAARRSAPWPQLPTPRHEAGRCGSTALHLRLGLLEPEPPVEPDRRRRRRSATSTARCTAERSAATARTGATSAPACRVAGRRRGLHVLEARDPVARRRRCRRRDDLGRPLRTPSQTRARRPRRPPRSAAIRRARSRRSWARRSPRSSAIRRSPSQSASPTQVLRHPGRRTREPRPARGQHGEALDLEARGEPGAPRRAARRASSTPIVVNPSAGNAAACARDPGRPLTRRPGTSRKLPHRKAGFAGVRTIGTPSGGLDDGRPPTPGSATGRSRRRATASGSRPGASGLQQVVADEAHEVEDEVGDDQGCRAVPSAGRRARRRRP